jgi:hypothetical protein
MITNQNHRTRHVETERDPLGMINGEGMITGTVVSAAAIAAAAGHFEEARLVLVVSEPHSSTGRPTCTLEGSATPSSTTTSNERMREALAETWLILPVAVLPAIILIVVQLLGGTVTTAAWTAVIACTALLTIVGVPDTPCRHSRAQGL